MQMGLERVQQRAQGGPGYPANGDANYAGLCDFACNRGNCPSDVCSSKPTTPFIPKSSPFTPDTCTSGTQSGDYKSVCQFACKYGFCPRNVCSCQTTGPLNLPPDVTDVNIKPSLFARLQDSGLCNFSCSRGDAQCPIVCKPEDFETPYSDDPWDFDWVKSYAALGGSFAAGIGVGTLRTEADAYDCSRYSGAYPLKIQATVRANNFKFTACSGAVISDVINNQVPQLGTSNNQVLWDLITVSAGGNDVGFSDVLKACLFLPSTDAKCQQALQDTESKIDTSLGPSAAKLLDLLQGRLSYRGVIVWTLYAKFFDMTADPCNQQSWCFVLEALCLKPTVGMREQFNRLVGKANAKLIETFQSWKKSRKFSKLQWADWGFLVESTDGQFCEPDSKARIDDDSNDKLAFIRFNLDDSAQSRKELKREVDYEVTDNHTMVEWKRQTAWYIPDRILKNFHPNDLGTTYQASTALGMISEAHRVAWAKPQLGDGLDSCPYVPPKVTPPLYQPGTCGIHVTQLDSCEPEDVDLTCQAYVVDNQKTEIARGGEIRTSCNDGNPFIFDTKKLPHPIVITGEHRGDYVQFQYGDFSWTSKDARCSEGAWDPKGSGDTCGIFGDKSRRTRNMDCIFPC